MPRYIAEVSYEGAYFSGWQLQRGLVTVQGVFEDALTLLNGGEHVSVAGAGRTDAGVHARGQVCTFDLKKDWNPRRLILALNANLPAETNAIRLVKAPCEDFHARFDAISREYIYFIWNASTIYPAIRSKVCWLRANAYDWERARRACLFLEGEHDFGAFCRSGNEPEDSVRTIYRSCLRKKGSLIMLRVTGSGFLTNMMRIIMGSLECVARGKKEPEWIKSLLEKKSKRPDCGRTFPPEGLFLWKINYSPPPWNSH